MASQQLRVIIDDNAGDIQYTGGQWTLSTLVQWYKATSNYPAFVTSTTFASLTFSFEGTSAAFIGNTPTADSPQFASVSIDGGPLSNTSYGSSAPPAYVQWYQSPTLSDGKHTIQMDRLDTAVDIVIVTVGPNTPLDGRNIFVDNNDPSIQYTGNWAENKSGFNAGTLPSGLPVGNTTQQSTTAGDMMTFRFSGTSIAIYGIFSWTNIGVVSATYTLDGNTQSLSYPVTENSPEHLSADADASNFLFYEQDNLSAGAHTLVMNITGLENHAFNLDYIVYTPSFSSLATMPNLTAIATSASASSSTASTAKTSTTSGAAIQSGDSNQTQSGPKGAPIGAIIGGVLGGLALLIVLVLLLLYMRRRRPNMNQSPMVQQYLVSGNGNGTPQMAGFTGAQQNLASASRDNITPFVMSTNPTTPGFASVSDNKRSLHDISRQRNLSTASPPNTASGSADDTSGLEYVSSAVPPAYEALSTHQLSTHQLSTLTSVRR